MLTAQEQKAAHAESKRHRNTRARRREPTVLIGTGSDGIEHTILIPPFGPCREVRRLPGGDWVCLSCIDFRQRGSCEHTR